MRSAAPPQAATPKGYRCVSTSPTIAGQAGNIGIATRIHCAKKPKAPGLGRRLEMPVDDLGTPSQHEGSICCEKETDRFSICNGDDVVGAAQIKQWGTTCMPLVLGLDIGTTSVRFAVIDHDSDLTTGKIHRLGVRIFPDARDPKGVPLNQERRQAQAALTRQALKVHALPRR